MARFEFKLPDIGEGVVEAEINKWLVNTGDAVTEDQPVVEVNSDKATVTISAPKAGKILELHGKEGQMAKVHDVLVVFEIAGAASAPAPVVDIPAGAGMSARKPEQAEAHSPSSRTVAPPPVSIVPSTPKSTDVLVLAAPATRRLARELGVNIQSVSGTGPAGRVTADDVRRAADGGAVSSSAPVSLAPTPLAHVAAGSRDEERIPVRGLRRAIAAKMRTSEDHVVPFTFVEACDVSELVALRERINKSQATSGGTKITFLPFVMKAIIAGLKKFPTLNGVFDEAANELVVKRYFNLGVGVATDAGLTVVVVKDADRKSISHIARELDQLASDARSGKIKPEDLTGSTFTITSLGVDGGMLATPVINYPELAILGIHKIKRAPVVVNEEIVIRDVMNVSCSFDHRMIDGHVGAAFTYEVIRYLEDPGLLFVELV